MTRIARAMCLATTACSDQGKDAFQVEADTKNNRLLLRANDLELQEVRQLMIKLGEDPFAGTEGDNMRVIHFVTR